MNTFIKFVIKVTSSIYEHSLREPRKVTVIAISSASAYETYYEKTKQFKVQADGIFSAELISEDAVKVLSEDETILLSDDVEHTFKNKLVHS